MMQRRYSVIFGVMLLLALLVVSQSAGAARRQQAEPSGTNTAAAGTAEAANTAIIATDAPAPSGTPTDATIITAPNGPAAATSTRAARTAEAANTAISATDAAPLGTPTMTLPTFPRPSPLSSAVSTLPMIILPLGPEPTRAPIANAPAPRVPVSPIVAVPVSPDVPSRSSGGGGAGSGGAGGTSGAGGSGGTTTGMGIGGLALVGGTMTARFRARRARSHR